MKRQILATLATINLVVTLSTLLFSTTSMAAVAAGTVDELRGHQLKMKEINNVRGLYFELKDARGKPETYEMGANCTEFQLSQAARFTHITLGAEGSLTLLTNPDICANPLDYNALNTMSIQPSSGNEAIMHFGFSKGTIPGIFSNEKSTFEVIASAKAIARCSIRIIYDEPSVWSSQFRKYITSGGQVAELPIKEKVLDCDIIEGGTGRVTYSILN